MEVPWISVYEPKEWSLYTIVLSSPEYHALHASLRTLEDAEFLVCGGESQAAANHWEKNHSVESVLFYDIEQLWSMGFDKVYGVSAVGVLTAEWKGHSAGSLVMSVYKGVTENPPCVTVGIAK